MNSMVLTESQNYPKYLNQRSEKDLYMYIHCTLLCKPNPQLTGRVKCILMMVCIYIYM